MRYNYIMKRVTAFFLTYIICSLTVSPVFAYVIKIYNDAGEQIGIARKNGDNYDIYDLNGNEVKDYDAFYASSGMNLKPVSNYDPTQYWIQTGPHSTRPLFFIPTPKLKIKRP